ncbi:MAG: hypothetical protein IEMM0006_0752 [bacterium]|nr:MAG: hypothetical protein IEMM0006_0752 [bacterium]
MKKIKTYFPVLLVLLFTGIGILSAQPEKNQGEYLNTLFRTDEEENINDISLNTTAVASEILFKKLVKTTFSNDEDKPINDIPFNTREIAKQHLSQKVKKSIFKEQDEAYINDIPPVILKAMKEYQQKLLANTTDK